MTEFNTTTLRQALAEIFFPQVDLELSMPYIIPIQGNWWNPVNKHSNPKGTWIGYSIPKRTPILRSRYDRKNNCHVTTAKAMIHLQFIGMDAESFATSVLHWDIRQDVMSILARFDGQLFYDKREVVQSMFYQDGANSTFAYNIILNMFYTEIVVPKNEIPVTGIELTGTLDIQEDKDV